MNSELSPQPNLADHVSFVLVSLLRFHGLPAEHEAMLRELGDKPTPIDQLRLLRRHTLRARAVHPPPSRLAHVSLPAIAIMADGGSLMLAKISEDEVLLLDPTTRRPATRSLSVFLNDWSGLLLLAVRRNAAIVEAERFTLRWFGSAVLRYRHILGEVLFASFFLQVFALAAPFAFQILVDKVLVNRGTSTLDVVAIGLVTIGLFEGILGGLRTYVFAHTTNRIDVELGARLFRHLLSLPLPYFQSRRVGDSISRVRELETIRQFLTGSALTLTMDLLFTGVFLAVMAVYSIPLTLIVLASLPLFTVISMAATPIFRRRLEDRFRRSAENQAFLVEAISSIETLKSMAVEPQMQKRWEEQLAGYVHSSQSVTSIGNLASQSVQVVSKLANAATLWFGAHEVIDGSLSVGGLVAFNMLSGRVTQPVLRLAQMYQDFHQTRLSVERLGDILNTPLESGNAAQTVLPALVGHVRFDNIRFRHRTEGPLVLDNVCLDVAAGSVIGIVGPSGSGKSTLTKLLQRLYLPETGRILVDGIDLAMVDGAWLRRQIGVVLQESVLFNMTVRENIALARPGMSMEQVVRAAKLAGAHDFILSLPNGYDTKVGERGGLLSGGQRQRVAIGRALATDPRILIFDEATSALDYESERVVQQNLRNICQRRTVFIIAHRLSAIRHADRIIAIEGGRLVEQGSHDELVRKGGRYAALYALQGGVGE